MFDRIFSMSFKIYSHVDKLHIPSPSKIDKLEYMWLVMSLRAISAIVRNSSVTLTHSSNQLISFQYLLLIGD